VLRVVSDMPHNREVINSATTGKLSQDVASFLAKPVPVVTGTLTPANLTASLLFKIDIANTMLAQPIWADKLRGFMNYRGTAKIRLQVNATPFQAGRLILAYIPQYIHEPRTYTTHLGSLMTITQLPHVEMSLQDTECELVIPYIAPTTHYSVLSGFYDWGTVFCYVYSPLATGTGSNTVRYTAWMSFDDFEVEVPIVPQSSYKGAKRDIIKKYRVNAIKSNLDSEVNEGKGPISSVLSNISSIATSLYTIPMLAPIAGPTAWMTNLASGVASAFGWCKPVLDTQVVRVYQQPHPYNPNINEPDLVHNLALFSDAKVSVMPDVNLSGVDEMSINFVKRQKSFFNRITWTTSTLPGPLSSFSVTPSFFSTPYTLEPWGLTSTIQCLDMSPVAFLSNLYQYWRGSIEITIKVVKTEFHTGRLILSFSPQLAQTTVTNSNTNYIHREIVDLRDGSEFVVKVPYCYNSMYMDTDQSQNDLFMMMQVNVLNELVAPDTCAQSVEILYEVRGGTDMEFQVPKRFNMTPTQRIVPQSGGDGQAELVLDHCIGSSTVHDPTKMSAELCIGESSTSLLQLMKRYLRMATPNNVWALNNSMAIYPYYFGAYFSNGLVSGGTSGYFTGDYVGTIAGCYAHSRGAIRYKFLALDGVPHFVKLQPYDRLTLAPASVTNITPATQNGQAPQQSVSQFSDIHTQPVVYEPTLSAGATAVSPMYNRTFCRLNRLFYTNNPGDALVSRAPDIVKNQIEFSATAVMGTNSSFHRCASDDFHFSFWLGVPTMGWILT
jgi:hypothetical protein